ncbi:MAG TPA: hypothetical protein VE032_08045 [Actinomycetota bacterium]|nr:hypothetical protein [Actinomycetota bacterium]
MPARGPSPIAGAWYEAQTLVARVPSIARPLQRLRGPERSVDDRTEIVIEAFPRCASSFAVAAFRLAQEPRAMRIADHSHSPAEVIAGVRRGLPVLVLARRAEPAVISHVIRNPDLPVRAVLRGYLRFYETVAPHRRDIVVGSFDEVTTDLGVVIARMNARFGTAFAPFTHTPANLARIEREIEDDYAARAGDDADRERIIPRPSATREDLKVAVTARFARETTPDLRRRADAVYDLLTGGR